MRILTLSSAYPNIVMPRAGVPIRERLSQLVKHCPVELTIVAPVPWFPLQLSVFGRYAGFARIPPLEKDLGTDVYHPRYLVVPKVGDLLTPVTYARAVQQCLRANAMAEFDAIYAHFFFPDGAAAVLLGRLLNCPVVITARGSDINSMPDELVAGKWIRWAARRCAAVVAVSKSLADRVEALGVGRDRLRILPNGVDFATFHVMDRESEKRRLGLSGVVVLSVGNLIELKGHHLVVEAVARTPEVQLVIAGDGPWRSYLERYVESHGLAGRVRLLKAIPHDLLARYYNAADMLVLASRSEGMPNVVLESLACGTPVIATAVGGSKEILNGRQVGLLLNERSADAIQMAIREMIERKPSRHSIEAVAKQYDWRGTVHGLMDVFRQVSMGQAQRRMGAGA